MIKFIDANILVRFLIDDAPSLSAYARDIFLKAEEGKLKIYIDEVILAEVIWVLTSYYKRERDKIWTELVELISQEWILNPRKILIIGALDLFGKTKLSYIDCWSYMVSRSLKIELETFDKDLKKLKR